MIIAGDISPIDVFSHIPIMCEDSGIPYIFVPSKGDLGRASLTKRPTSCVIISDAIASIHKKSYGAIHNKILEVNQRRAVAW